MQYQKHGFRFKNPAQKYGLRKTDRTIADFINAAERFRIWKSWSNDWIAFFRPNDLINKVKILDFILLSERLYIYLPNINSFKIICYDKS